MRYNYRVGSRDEYLFFKVKLCTGECGPDTNSMFYESPENYEKAHRCTLPDLTKTNWRERCNEELLYRKYQADQRAFGEMTVIH